MNPLTFILCLLLVALVYWTGYVMGLIAGTKGTKERIQQQMDEWAAEYRRDRIVLRGDESDEKRQH